MQYSKRQLIYLILYYLQQFYLSMKNWCKMLKDPKNQPNLNQNVRFQSGMTSEQKFNQITESVLSSMSYQPQVVKGCPMHPKISKKCRKCIELEKDIQQKSMKQQKVLEETFPNVIKLNTTNPKSHFNQKLQKNIEDSPLYKSKIRNILSVKDLVNGLTPEQVSIDAYIPGSSDSPTQFIVYFYRLAEMRPTHEQLTIMLRSNNINVRCLALLYLRVFADANIVYGCLCGSFKDNKLLNTMTIGEYAMRLFDEQQLNHGGFRIPRLPIKIQQQINRRVNNIKQERQKIFQRERSRSRERLRQRQQQIEQRQKQQQLQSLQNQEQFVPPKPKIQLNQQPKQLTLKERIRIIQQKNQAELRRRALLASYQAQNTAKLDSGEEQAFEEDNQTQKYRIG